MTRTLLAIESSTDWLSVALLEGENVLVFEEHAHSRQHASALLPAIDVVLTRGGLGLDDLDAIGIATGPGSFTSLRIGLATIKGLALGREIVSVGVSTLEAMALSVLEGDPETREGGVGAGLVAGLATGSATELVAGEGSGEFAGVVALLDARRGEWYAGGWSRPANPGGLPIAMLPEGLYAAGRLREERDLEAIVMGPDAALWRRGCDDAGVAPGRMIEGRAARPRADSVGRLAARRLALGEAVPVAELEARYLRRAEAEAKRLGAPVEAGEVARLGQT
jgi:tRNA threonylcarbamoyl adenosine modification protein YeaZ